MKRNYAAETAIIKQKWEAGIMMRKLFTLALTLILAAGCIGALAEGKP